MSNFKRQRVKDETHEDFIRALPCCIPMCGDNTSTEAAHVSYAEPRIGKFGRGKGQKEESIWVVPLCGRHHAEQHARGNERAWWRDRNVDPCRLAAGLYLRTGDYQTALQIIDAQIAD
jgi:hypothetical protein